MNKKEKAEYFKLFSEAFHAVVVPAIEDSEKRTQKEIRENRKLIRNVEHRQLTQEEKSEIKEDKYEELEKRVRTLEGRVLAN